MSKFDTQPVTAPSRGVFNLSNMHTTTLDFGRLQVAKIMEVVPEDVININLGAYVQAAPNPSTINGKMTFSAHAFFVPTRVICDQWNNYILGLSTVQLPYFTKGRMNIITAQMGSTSDIYERDSLRHLSDMGLPSSYVYDQSTMSDDYRINALPFRAFNRVWFDWYRDKQRISDANMASYCYTNAGSVSDAELAVLCQPKYRCFTKDYITTAYDAPAEDGAISAISIGIAGNGNTLDITNFQNDNRNPKYVSSYTVVNNRLDNTHIIDSNTGTTANVKSPIDSSPYSLTTSVPQLRGAAAYQRYLERLLVSGKSVISRLKALFNADDTPERLDMSEYLGGTSTDFTFANTTATSAGASASAVSEIYSAFGTYGSNGAENILGQKVSNGECSLTFPNVTYHSREHGYILIVTSILPVLQNYQGIDRMFLRGVATGTNTPFDYWHEDMENVGFQPVLMSEVVTPCNFSGTIPATYDGLSVFGWQQRYMDYKYAHDQLSGDFVNPDTYVSLQSYHFGRNILRELGFVTAFGDAVTGASAPTSYAAEVTPAALVECGPAARTMFDDKFTISSNELDHFIVNYKLDIIANRPMQQNVLPAIEDSDKAIMNIPTGGVRL